MASDLSELDRCKKIIEQKLDWGSSEHWQSIDFENLNQVILDQTSVSLSVSTLRRIWGRVEYNHLPSLTTLNTLARFAGYGDWRNFIRLQTNLNPAPVLGPANKKLSFSRHVKKLIGILVAGVSIGLISMLAFEKGEPQTKKESYIFSIRPVTSKIPNSVIFTYDATASPTDSVFIQQSWDNTKQALVDKNLKQHTSIYYKPGVYTAKLVIGKKIVKKHTLMIPTKGWLGLIEGKPVPVYLKDADFIKNDRMQLPISVIEGNNIPMQPQTPMIQYYNVGNFTPVSLKDFSFSSEVKNDFNEGSAACQLSSITLLTNENPIIIPLSVKGCVSEINMLSIDRYVSGKKTDLSAFGVDFSDWNLISCKTEADKIKYFVNNQFAVEFALPKREIKVVGLIYTFMGTGSVKNISIGTHNKAFFQAFPSLTAVTN
jgi:hypothetical protein